MAGFLSNLSGGSGLSGGVVKWRRISNGIRMIRGILWQLSWKVPCCYLSYILPQICVPQFVHYLVLEIFKMSFADVTFWAVSPFLHLPPYRCDKTLSTALIFLLPARDLSAVLTAAPARVAADLTCGFSRCSCAAIAEAAALSLLWLTRAL